MSGVAHAKVDVISLQNVIPIIGMLVWTTSWVCDRHDIFKTCETGGKLYEFSDETQINYLFFNSNLSESCLPSGGLTRL